MTALSRVRQGLLQRPAQRVVLAVSARPALYFWLRRLTGSLDALCVARDTEIVIEGFPRSANSTTVTLFRTWQRRKVKVGHHKHHAAQILRAVDWDIPAVALIREPRAAVLSLLAMLEETRRRAEAGESDPAAAAQTGGAEGRALIEAGPDFEAAFRWWIRFYAPLLPVRDRIVIAPFETATGDLGAVIEAVNARYGTAFRTTPPKRKTDRTFGWRSMPNPVRDAVKLEMEAAFAAALQTDAGLRALVEEAEGLYRRILDGA